MDNQEKIIDLIKKCLALSESPNEYEASLAMEKAQELLEKYNLSLVDVKETVKIEPELIECTIHEKSGTWQQHLYTIVAKYNFCYVIGNTSYHCSSVLGRYVNVMATIEMEQWLQGQIERLTKEEMFKHSKFKIVNGSVIPENRSLFEESFIYGIINNIDTRFKNEQVARQGKTSGLYALTITLADETKQFVNKTYPNLVSRKAKMLDRDAMSKGFLAGNGISTHAPSHQVSGGPLRLN